jgi:hypothetical protein
MKTEETRNQPSAERSLTVSDAKAASFGKEDFFRIILP